MAVIHNSQQVKLSHLHVHPLYCKHLEIRPHWQLIVAQGLGVRSEHVEQGCITANLETFATTSGSLILRFFSNLPPSMGPSWPNKNPSFVLSHAMILL